MCAITARVDDAFGDAFMVEMKDLFPEMRVFEQRGTARAGFKTVLIVGHRDALFGSQRGNLATRYLVRFAAAAHRFGKSAVRLRIDRNER